MPLNLIKFFTPSYLFEMRPAIDIKTIYFLLLFFGGLVVLALVIRFLAKAKKREIFLAKLWRKYSFCLSVMGLIGLVYILLRYETVLVLSSRFWLMLWLVGFIIWLFFILKYQFKIVPKIKVQLEQKQIFNKYLPKKK